MSAAAADHDPPSRVLFVDDEPHLLSGLRRRLHSLVSNWDVKFVESGPEALALLEREPVDVVVSDLRMPGMDGATLLNRIQDEHPATVRIVLTGEAERGTLLAVSSAAHQFLSKPCEPELLVSAISRALEVRSDLRDPDLRDLMGRIRTLPSMPDIYTELMEAVSRPGSNVEQIAKILAEDVAASVEVLRLTNSSFFGLRRQVDSVAQAVSLLGLDTMHAVVVAGLLFKSRDEPFAVNISRLRSEALQRTAMVRSIAQREQWPRADVGPVSLAAMLRDVGALALGEGRAEQFVALAERWEEEPEALDDPRTVRDIERSTLGCSIPQASAYLLTLWGFAPQVQHTLAGQPALPPQPGMQPGEVAIAVAQQRIVRPHEKPEAVLRLMDGVVCDLIDRATVADWIRLCDEVAGRLEDEDPDLDVIHA